MRPAVVVAVLLSGCVGSIETGSGGNSGAPDAGGGADGTSDAPAAFACRNKVATVGSGNHNAGEDCQGACHNHGFTLAGTIFAAPNSSIPLVGATITVVDATGRVVDVVSQRNGNFYTSQRFTFPVSVTASTCPNVAPMVTRVTATMDGCNQGGCHVAGGQGVIHLP